MSVKHAAERPHVAPQSASPAAELIVQSSKCRIYRSGGLVSGNPSRGRPHILPRYFLFHTFSSTNRQPSLGNFRRGFPRNGVDEVVFRDLLHRAKKCSLSRQTPRSSTFLALDEYLFEGWSFGSACTQFSKAPSTSPRNRCRTHPSADSTQWQIQPPLPSAIAIRRCSTNKDVSLRTQICSRGQPKIALRHSFGPSPTQVGR